MNTSKTLYLGITIFLLTVSQIAKADPHQGFSLGGGLTQPLLFHGGNIAGRYISGRWAIEYSHGFNLKLHDFKDSLTSEEKKENLELFLPWTTGGGVGHYLTDNLSVFLELKAHRYEVNVPGGPKAEYTTYSAGPGVFYDIHLFKGILLQPNIRFWPNVASSESGSKINIKRMDGSTYEHQLHDFGFFANMTLGYEF